MRQINCYIPIKLRISGELSQTELDQLGDGLARAVAARIAFAERTILARHGGLSAGGEVEVREGYDPTREDVASEGYFVPSYQAGGQPKSVSVLRRTQGRPWFVRKAIYFRATIGEFINIIDKLRVERSMGRVPWANAYFGMSNELRRISLWLVQVNEPFLLTKLADVVSERARQLGRVRSNQFLAFVMGTDDDVRQHLAAIDEVVLREIPSMARNARFVQRDGDNFKLQRGAWALFASMTLPKIELAQVADLEYEVPVTLRLRHLAFVVPPTLFERRHGVSWNDYVQEFGERPVVVHIQPVTVRQRVHVISLQYLVDQAVMQRIQQTSQEESWFGRLYILNDATLGQWPAAVRDQAAFLTNALTRSLDNGQTYGDLEPDWKAAYIYTMLTISQQDIDAARYRPMARELVEQLIPLIEESLSWHWTGVTSVNRFPFERFVRVHARLPLFEFLLEALEKRDANRRWFNRFFEAIKNSYGHGNWELTRQVIRVAIQTKYANDPQVQALIDLHNKHQHGRLRHTYDVANQKVILNRGFGDVTVSVGDVFGAIDEDYLREREEYEPKDKDKLQKAVREESQKLIEQIEQGAGLAGAREYTVAELERAVLEAVVQRHNLTEADFEKVTIQQSIRLLGLEAVVQDGYWDRVVVTYQVVEREEGHEWPKLDPNIRQSMVDSEFDYYLYRLESEKTAEVFVAFITVGVAVVTAVVAWKFGVVRALVSLGRGGVALAGGTKVVLTSIVISEIIYLIFADDITWEGVLLAALDGYLGALIFRGAGITMRRFLPASIGTHAVRGAYYGWFFERLGIGILGGGGTGAAIRFTHDLVAVISGRGDWSSADDYAASIGWGALIGVGAEFAGATLVEPMVAGSIQSSVHTAAQFVDKVLRPLGISPARWSAWSVQALANMRQKISELRLRHPEKVNDIMMKGYELRLAQVGEAFTSVGRGIRQNVNLSVYRRLLQLKDVQLSQSAIQGLEKFLKIPRADLPEDAALALINDLRPTQLGKLLETLNTLDDQTIRTLSKAEKLGSLANAPETAQSLASRLKADNGKVVVNIGGTGAPHEPAQAINLNPNIVAPRKGIPNHVEAPGEVIGSLFQPGTIDGIVGHRLPHDVLNWNQIAPGARGVLRSGGRFDVNFRWAHPEEAAKLARALKSAGFINVEVIGDVAVSAVKP